MTWRVHMCRWNSIGIDEHQINVCLAAAQMLSFAMYILLTHKRLQYSLQYSMLRQ